jgi:hypothetical protein
VANPLPHWHVEGGQVRQETTLAQTGAGLDTYWVVPYTIEDGPAKGTTHTLHVPIRDFTPAGVKEAVEADLHSVHGVAGLSSRNA